MFSYFTRPHGKFWGEGAVFGTFIGGTSIFKSLLNKTFLKKLQLDLSMGVCFGQSFELSSFWGSDIP